MKCETGHTLNEHGGYFLVDGEPYLTVEGAWAACITAQKDDFIQGNIGRQELNELWVWLNEAEPGDVIAGWWEVHWIFVLRFGGTDDNTHSHFADVGKLRCVFPDEESAIHAALNALRDRRERA